MTPKQQVNMQFWGKRVVPEIIQTVERLEEMFGDELEILCMDKGFLNFRVKSWADRLLIRHLEQHQNRLFPGGFREFQVLCPWDTTNGRGVFLHHLPSMTDRSSYRCGFWYY